MKGHRDLMMTDHLFELDFKEMDRNSKKISRAHLVRIQDQDNTLVHLLEMNSAESFQAYHDTYPCLALRKKVWRLYMYPFLTEPPAVLQPGRDQPLPLLDRHLGGDPREHGLPLLRRPDHAPADPARGQGTRAVIQMEIFFVIAYSLEAILKIIGLGLIMKRGSYLRDPWNVLDFLIIITSYFSLFQDTVNFNILRTIRILRPLRTITVIKSLRSIIRTILGSIPHLVDILVVLFFGMLMFAVAGLQMFRGNLQNRCVPEATGKINSVFNDSQLCGGLQTCREGHFCGKIGLNPVSGIYSFDNVASSLLMVFIATTMEGWSVAASRLMATYGYTSLFFFVSIIFIGSFFLLNLALAIITSKYQQSQTEQINGETSTVRNKNSKSP
jgi:hypothetical protein